VAALGAAILAGGVSAARLSAPGWRQRRRRDVTSRIGG